MGYVLTLDFAPGDIVNSANHQLLTPWLREPIYANCSHERNAWRMKRFSWRFALPCIDCYNLAIAPSFLCWTAHWGYGEKAN
jgi:hypothetical protein